MTRSWIVAALAALTLWPAAAPAQETPRPRAQAAPRARPRVETGPFGVFSFRSFACEDPCGLWQVRQLSSTGGCENTNGPRLSAWQDLHWSLTDSCLTIACDSAPCGLWQSEHLTLPSVIG